MWWSRVDPSEVVRVHQSDEGVEVVGQLGGAVADHLHPAGGEVHVSGDDVPVPHAIGAGDHCVLPPPLAASALRDVVEDDE